MALEAGAPFPARLAGLGDEMVEALARGVESRLVTGTMRAILQDLAGNFIGQFCRRRNRRP
jgi:hypothetical protein